MKLFIFIKYFLIAIFAILFIIFANNIFFYIAFAAAFLPLLYQTILSIKEKDIDYVLMLMLLASIGLIVIKEYYEALALLLLYCFGEYLEELGKEKSRSRLMKLLAKKLQSAHLYDGTIIKDIEAKNIKKDDKLLVNKYEKIYTDSTLLSNEAIFDPAALTGESLPITLSKNQTIPAGYILLSENIDIISLTDYSLSNLAEYERQIKEIENSQGKTEIFLDKFAKYYIFFVLIVSTLIFAFFYLTNNSINTSLYNALSILVLSCPCSLVVVPPLRGLIILGRIAKKHSVLLKGADTLEKLTECSSIAFDKTGTLTENTFTLYEVVNLENTSNLINIAISLAKYSSHPLSKCIYSTYLNYETIDFTDIIERQGYGMISSRYVLGNQKLLEESQIKVLPTSKTTVYLGDKINQKLLGYFTFETKIKLGVVSTINKLKSMNYNITILSGDKIEAVKDIANKLNISSYYAELLPEHKAEYLSKNSNYMFVGDGINDIKAATTAKFSFSIPSTNVELLMQSSDAVLLDSNIENIIPTIIEAKNTKKMIWFAFFLAIIFKLFILILTLFGYSSIYLSLGGDVGVLIIIILLCLVL